MEEEQEISQPLVVNTVLIQDVSQNREHLEREERVIIEIFLVDRCGCDGGCSSMFMADSLESHRSEYSELTRAELDMVLFGQLSAFTYNSTLTVHSTDYRHSSSSRQKP